MKYIVTFSLLTLLARSASAQIQITSSDFLSYFNSISTEQPYEATTPTDPKFQALVNLSGGLQTWSFAGPTYAAGTQTNLTISDNPTAAPLGMDPAFAGATHVLTVNGNVYEYIKVNTDGYWVLGTVSNDASGTQVISSTYTPPLQEEKFPLKSGITWSSTSNHIVAGMPAGETITVSIDGSVDGYGTLVLPGGGAFDALRTKVKNSTVTTVVIAGTTNRFTSTTNSFSWVTTQHYTAAISTDSNLNPQSASYSTPTASDVTESPTSDGALNLRLSYNPSSSSDTKLSFTLKADGPVQVEMMDALGRSVQVLQDGRASSGENIIPIDPKLYAPGSYFIRVTGDGMSAIRKLIITR
ncbi:MAG TPA: T9SS type A sorting domain-containing protein [Candidatus Kapabacteria bacterium]|jgi:hypothetical protein|nr:T9SS type A sorting domain-containing protein [Candidatus Kapabacteria bacterium]